MDYSKDFIGLVLCGGRSTRMGQDKGLIRSGNTTWAEKQYQKLSTLNISTYVSVNESQAVAYQKIFAPDQLIADYPFSDINGPLQGILSAHRAFPGKHIICVTCDMPGVNRKFLSEIMEVFVQNYPARHLFIPLVKGRLQPLCGIYTKECLRHFSDQYEAGNFANKSMMNITENYPKILTLMVEDKYSDKFENYNAPEDLK